MFKEAVSRILQKAFGRVDGESLAWRSAHNYIQFPWFEAEFPT
jgi:hypothetical protein